jgi:PEP-CTERM motif
VTALTNTSAGIVAFALAFSSIALANATVVDFGHFSGNDCKGGAFVSCAADSSGVGPDHAGSLVIYKLESDGSEDFGSFATISGKEFVVNFDTTSDILTWTYTPGPGDPSVNYFDIKQADGYELFGDPNNPINSFSVKLDTLFGKQGDGFSHITWFDNPAGPQPDPPTPVPEPASLPLLLSALASLALAARKYLIL